MVLPDVPALPHTFRPTRGRWAALVAAAAFLLVMTVIAVLLPDDGPAGFHLYDRLLVVLVGLLVAAVLVALARVRVRADDVGVLVVNVVRRRHLAWAQVVTVRLSRDDPWAMLDLSDGTALAAMAIQTADGDRARTAALQLALLVEARSGAAGNAR